MFRWAVLFLILSLTAGGLGLTNISQFAKRISMILFGLFFLGFLALLGLPISSVQPSVVLGWRRHLWPSAHSTNENKMGIQATFFASSSMASYAKSRSLAVLQ